jgi:FO synthase
MSVREADETAAIGEPWQPRSAVPSGSGELNALAAEAETLLRELESLPAERLLAQACALREQGHGRIISYSRKVFIPLTRLCRDSCAYCTFAAAPSQVAAPFLSPDEVLAIAKAGQRARCHEALFTLGDKPELRYAAARRALDEWGYASTVDYLAAMCDLVLKETGLLPHVNGGVMTDEEIERLRPVSVSQGIMLESISERLCERGGPHFGSPDKAPGVRLAMVASAGRLRVPFTSGILIGIGETRRERIESLLALRELHARYGHLQEIIIQNFRAKPHTRMGGAAEPGLDELLWTAAAARMIFGPAMNIQAPPNLSYEQFARLLDSGINDWGGVSPVTPDHVNPEAPWPDLRRLEQATSAAGLALAERTAAYPEYVHAASRWIDPRVQTHLLRSTDAAGFARDDDWSPGLSAPLPRQGRVAHLSPTIERVLARASAGARLSEDEIVTLFSARGGDVEAVCSAADNLRRRASGEVVRYVVNRNINYTNVCTFKCGFCAFSKGKLSESLRGRPYDLDHDEVARRAREAWDRGATEVCMQGGINPGYTGETYLALLRAVKSDVPQMHVHAFSPLEVSQGAASLGIPVRTFLARLRDAGLGSLPGTAAEILDDEVRAIICPDKLSTREWLAVVGTAHEVGLPTTATIMFGHVERPRHWARHLLAIRDLQERTGGFTEFVPLPFVHMEAPLYMRGRARKGPTWREVRLMHAVARLALHPLIRNIQASWVKLGTAGVTEVLRGGVNDLGGTLMNESISRAAGTQHGQELGPEAMEALIAATGRVPQQRTTLYAAVPAERRATSFAAAPLTEVVLTAFGSKRRASAACRGHAGHEG